MKKKILFAIIALVTLLAFTGCDKILEFMFPDSTGGGDGGWGTNSIQAQISVADPSIQWWNYTVWVELSVVNTDGTLTPVGEAYRSGPASVPFDQPEATPTAMFRYDGLADGTYSIKAWMDVNGNWGADTEDPVAQGHTDTGLQRFSLPFMNFDGTTMNEIWVFGELALPVDIGGSTPFLFVKDGLTQPADYTGYNFNIDSTVEWRQFTSISYDIYDPWGYWIWGGTANSNYIFADMTTSYPSLAPGTYTLSIYSALDNAGVSITPWQWNTSFQVVDRYQAVGYWAKPDVVNYTLGGAPFNLTGAHPVQLQFWDYWSTFAGQYDVPGSWGWFEAWNSNGSTPPIYIADGVNYGKVRILVDVDNNGNYYDSADLAAEQILWVDATQWFDGFDYRPYYNIDIGRFIPYGDFFRIYGY